MNALLLLVLSAAVTPKVAVTDVSAPPELAQVAGAASGVLASEYQRLGIFEVVSSEQVQKLISLERQKALLGDDSGSALELGGMLHVDYLSTGRLSRLDAGDGKSATFNLELLFIDARSGKRLSSQTLSAESAASLIERLHPAVVKLAQPVLSTLSGTLLVSSSENGATVKIDDVVRGTTPLPGRLELPAGPHILVVEKEGFVAAQKEVRVEPSQLCDESVTLMPSADFIQAYEAKAKKMRWGAYGLAGLGAAAIALAVVEERQGDVAYGTPETPGTFAFARNKLQQHVETDGATDYRALANSSAAQVQTAQTLTAVGAVVGAAALGGAAYLFIAGDPPGRYTRFGVVSANAMVAPTKDGAQASVAFRF